jgi:hypothetical protein
MTDIREVLRRWSAGQAVRAIARETAVDRKTVDRYVAAARVRGFGRGSEVSDTLVAEVNHAVQDRPLPPASEQWKALETQRIRIERWLQAETRPRCHRETARAPAPSPALRGRSGCANCTGLYIAAILCDHDSRHVEDGLEGDGAWMAGEREAVFVDGDRVRPRAVRRRVFGSCGAGPNALVPGRGVRRFQRHFRQQEQARPRPHPA